MRYVDGFVVPIPKKNVPAYRALARKAAKIWREYGALEYRECVGEDLGSMGGATFPEMAGAKRDETVVFAWIAYKSRAHRDKVTAKVMKDPRITSMMKGKSPFDIKRMAYGGFQAIVEA